MLSIQCARCNLGVVGLNDAQMVFHYDVTVQIYLCDIPEQNSSW